MKALTLQPGTTNLGISDIDEPQMKSPDEIKLRIIRVGICGTDREEAQGGRARAPAGKDRLVIGHEMLGKVEDIGKAVTKVKKGDLAVFTVRRGCGECIPCAMDRPDMCLTGKYRERGIWEMDGYQTEFVVDKERYIVRLPPELEEIGVLTEPLTIAEKAIDESLKIAFARLPSSASTPDCLSGRKCLVAGLGPVGLLAALALRLRGADVYGLDIVDSRSARPQWLEFIGGKYLDGRQILPDKVDDSIGAVDLIFEAAGIPQLEFNLLDALNRNGIYVLTGIPGGDKPVEVPGAQLIRRLVLKNYLMFGSVNAARGHFQMAANDLLFASLKWKGHVGKLITNRHPYPEFKAAFAQHGADEIKVVMEWSD